MIIQAGKPLMRMPTVNSPTPARKNRVGFLSGQVTVPVAMVFNELGVDEIAAMFGDEAIQADAEASFVTLAPLQPPS